mgnify:CR=1 FL=1
MLVLLTEGVYSGEHPILEVRRSASKSLAVQSIPILLVR